VSRFSHAIEPSWFNPLFETFNFEPGTGQRLTAVLLAAVVVLFLLLVRMQSSVDTNERSLSYGQTSVQRASRVWDWSP